MNYAPRDPQAYLNWLSVKPEDRLDIIAVDQEKFNLTWLAFPEIDQHGLEVIPQEYVASLHTYMDKQTRKMLGTLPLMFMSYWNRILDHEDQLGLTIGMPDDFFARMTTQAHKAQARLVVRESNLITPTFWRKTA